MTAVAPFARALALILCGVHRSETQRAIIIKYLCKYLPLRRSISTAAIGGGRGRAKPDVCWVNAKCQEHKISPADAISRSESNPEDAGDVEAEGTSNEDDRMLIALKPIPTIQKQ
jgi:hypothetical protein